VTKRGGKKILSKPVGAVGGACKKGNKNLSRYLVWVVKRRKFLLTGNCDHKGKSKDKGNTKRISEKHKQYKKGKLMVQGT